jgi:hypothetical protein
VTCVVTHVQPSHCSAAGWPGPHEVVGDEHPAAFKNIQQRHRPTLADKPCRTLDLDHGQPAARGCNRITFSCVSFLSNPQCIDLGLECGPIDYFEPAVHFSRCLSFFSPLHCSLVSRYTHAGTTTAGARLAYPALLAASCSMRSASAAVTNRWLIPLELGAHFAKVLLRFEGFERTDNLLQRKLAVDNWFHAIHCYGITGPASIRRVTPTRDEERHPRRGSRPLRSATRRLSFATSKRLRPAPVLVRRSCGVRRRPRRSRWLRSAV